MAPCFFFYCVRIMCLHNARIHSEINRGPRRDFSYKENIVTIGKTMIVANRNLLLERQTLHTLYRGVEISKCDRENACLFERIT